MSNISNHQSEKQSIEVSLDKIHEQSSTNPSNEIRGSGPTSEWKKIYDKLKFDRSILTTLGDQLLWRLGNLADIEADIPVYHVKPIYTAYDKAKGDFPWTDAELEQPDSYKTEKISIREFAMREYYRRLLEPNADEYVWRCAQLDDQFAQSAALRLLTYETKPQLNEFISEMESFYKLAKSVQRDLIAAWQLRHIEDPTSQDFTGSLIELTLTLPKYYLGNIAPLLEEHLDRILPDLLRRVSTERRKHQSRILDIVGQSASDRLPDIAKGLLKEPEFRSMASLINQIVQVHQNRRNLDQSQISATSKSRPIKSDLPRTKGNRPATPGSSSSNTICILVHGTYAPNAEWAAEGSELRTHLRSTLTGSHQIEFREFLWSGRNTHRARIRASLELALLIKELRTEQPNVLVHLIGHSHGGNICLNAQNHLNDKERAVKIVTLGTPFISAEPQLGYEQVFGHGGSGTVETPGWLNYLRFWVFLFLMMAAILPFILPEARSNPIVAGLLNISQNLKQSLSISDNVFGLLLLIPLTILAVLLWQVAKFVLSPLYPPINMAQRLIDRLSRTSLAGTRVLSVEFEEDEARRYLSFISGTHAATRGGASSAGMVFVKYAALAIFVGGPIMAVFRDFLGIDIDRYAQDVVRFFRYGELPAFGLVSYAWIAIAIIIIVSLFVTLALYIVQLFLAFWRGSPFGFGFENPFLHKYVSIKVEQNPTLDEALEHKFVRLRFAESKQAGKKSDYVHNLMLRDPSVLSHMSEFLRSKN